MSNIKHNLHNTHSWNRLRYRVKGHLELAVKYCKWLGDRALCWLLAQEVGWGLQGVGHHSVTQTQCSKSSEFTKHQNSSCSIVMQYTVHVDTIETTMSSFSRVSMSSLAVKGLGPGRLDDFTPLLAVAFQRRWHRFSTLLALRQGSRGRRPQLESMIRRRFNSSASAVFDQTSYLDVTSHFTK